MDESNSTRKRPESHDGDEIARVPNQDSVISQLMGMGAALWVSHQRKRALMLFLALVAVVGATAYAQILLNAWNRPFYNALSNKNISEFVKQLGVFAELAGVLLVLNVAQTWLNQKSRVILRKGLVEDLETEWLTPLRAFRVSHAGELGQNPDQRIHEDARHLTELTTDLGVGLLQSTLLLASFVGVLWVLSSTMSLSFGGSSFVIPGYMVWCALVYAGAGSLMSWRVGRPLIHLNAERYAREADYRFALVRVNEEIEGITLSGGESDERERLDSIFSAVVAAMERIVRATTGLTWVTAGVGWMAIVAPILVAAPAYFHSATSFGELMMIVGAFNQVQQALGWYTANFSSIADWQAALLRVASFRKMLLTMDKLGESENRIELDEREGDSIVIDDLKIATPSGCVMLSEAHVEFKPGERVLVVGEEAHERLLFRAIVGLWPWGHGRIARPSHHSVIFVPAPGYAPPGTLRESLAYPHPPEAFDLARISEAFAAAGLAHLEPMLDEKERWDRVLSDTEKRGLALARVLLQKPRWVVINRPVAGLGLATRRRLAEAFARDLANVGVVFIGRAFNDGRFDGRTLNLSLDPHGPTFKPAVEASTALGGQSAREPASAK
jgi:putative ATP-binding cassette transporter